MRIEEGDRGQILTFVPNNIAGHGVGNDGSVNALGMKGTRSEVRNTGKGVKCSLTTPNTAAQRRPLAGVLAQQQGFGPWELGYGL